MKYLFLIGALLSVGYGFAMQDDEAAERKKCTVRILVSYLSRSNPLEYAEFYSLSCAEARKFLAGRFRETGTTYVRSLEIEGEGVRHFKAEDMIYPQALDALDRATSGAYKK